MLCKYEQFCILLQIDLQMIFELQYNTHTITRARRATQVISLIYNYMHLEPVFNLISLRINEQFKTRKKNAAKIIFLVCEG